ncbi:MAG: alpha/beta hydrolase-fold protein, partial [Bacteroidota bacterium]
TRSVAARTLVPTIVVGIHAGDRMREYGTAGRVDYQGRGDLAMDHEQFILEELIPFLEGRFNIRKTAAHRAIAGFSLGGLNAFDLAWRNPTEFGAAGIFSGALWWRHKAFRPKAPDADRIVHDYVRKAKKAPNVRFWFMAGTEDETDDRNNNGIIDAIDDTLQLMALLADKGKKEGEDFTYVEVEGGKHEPETWGEVVMDFLRWV